MDEEIKEGGTSFKFNKFPLFQTAVLFTKQHHSTKQMEPPWKANREQPMVMSGTHT